MVSPFEGCYCAVQNFGIVGSQLPCAEQGFCDKANASAQLAIKLDRLRQGAVNRAFVGDFEQALALLEPAIAQHNSRAGGRYNEYYFPYFLGVALHHAGRADDAVAAARQACDAAASFEEVGHQARALRLLARLEALAGRDLDAATHLAESRALAQQCGMDWPTLEAACEVALEAPASPRGHRLAPQDHA